MKRLWAPWRKEYVGELFRRQDGDCFLCLKHQESDDEANFVLWRGRTAYALMNVYPYNSGHLLLAPYRHVPCIEDLTEEEISELGSMVKVLVRALKRAYDPQGFNVGANLGRAAGAGVPEHLHLHLVPRWNGDTNFMPVIGEVKVISESLEDTFARLKGHISELLGSE